MSSHSWLQNLRSALAPGRRQRHDKRRGSLRATTHRPNIELLEDRSLLSFSPAVSYPVGPDPVAVATADFNNDGRLDLATANAGNATVSVLLGDGLGGFGAANQFATGASPRSLAVGDFDGDGNLDLVTATHNLRYVSVLLGNGEGAFQPPVTTDTIPRLNAGTYPSLMAAADFNSDGKTDLAFAINYPSEWEPGLSYNDVRVLPSDGQGGFAGFSSFFGVGLGMPSALVVADLNADGKSDVITVSGYFDYSTFSDNNYINVGINSWFFSFETSRPSQGVAVGDFTRDGHPDIVIGGETLEVWPGDGDGSFGSPISTSPGGAVAAVADFNGDGALDVDTGGSILLGLGDGTFTAPIDYAAGASPTVEDFNGDGLPDVAIVDAVSNAVSVLLNDGAWGDLPGDVNGDGVVDIVDVNVVSAHWGGPGPLGDANHDGMVDIFDVNLISANWTGTQSSSVSTDVSPPATQTAEPTSVAAVDSTKHSEKPTRKTSVPEPVVGVDSVFASWHRFDMRGKGRARAERAPTRLDNPFAAHHPPLRS